MPDKNFLFNYAGPGPVCDASVITLFTDAMYDNEEIAPTYNEFRDMFSSGQVLSKLWIIRALYDLDVFDTIQNIVIAGSWYGSLGLMLNRTQPKKHINLLDIDSRCEKFIQCMTHNNPQIAAITCDMYDYKYTEDLVINTSCEHIPDLQEWLSNVPPNTVVVLQSNNHTGIDGHINCVQSIDEFIKKVNLADILHSDSYNIGMYTRYMIIGAT